jgi:hemin uptake protein HemP
MVSEPPVPTPKPPPGPDDRLRVFDSGELFGPDRELVIRHQRETYRLRITRSGKLILTK